MSYTKVRALTRVANAANESDLIDMTMRMSARYVEEHCKQRTYATKVSSAVARKAQQNSTFRVWHDQAHGTVHFSVELPAEEAELIEKAVEKAGVQLSANTGSAAARPEESVSWATQQTDALVFLCRSFLDGETSVENMVLLCSSHHKLAHEGGYSVQRDQTGELFFRRPDGKAVPYSGYHLQDQVEDDALQNGPDVDSAVADYVKNSREFFGVQENSVGYEVNRLSVCMIH